MPPSVRLSFFGWRVVAGAFLLAGSEVDTLFAPTVVEETKALLLQGRRATLDAVDFDVLATGNGLRLGDHRCKVLIPSPLESLESSR